jgi:hypothetical protein
MACTTRAATMADTISVIVAGVISVITVITAAIMPDTIAAISAIIGIIVVTTIADTIGIIVTTVAIIIRTTAVSGMAAGMRMASPRAGGGRTTTMSSSGFAIERPLNITRLGALRAAPFL